MVADQFTTQARLWPNFRKPLRQILPNPQPTLHAVGWRVALVCLGLTVALPSVAQTVPAPPNPAPLVRDDLPDVQKRSRSVAILPILVDLPAVEDLFGADRQRSAPAVPDIAASILRVATGQPYVAVLSVARVRDALAGDAEGQLRAHNAEDWYRKGLQLYLGLGPQAPVYLRQAVSDYTAAFQDLIEAKPFADAQFMLGVSLIDSGDKDAGHIALKEAFRLEPMRRFRANFFPPAVNAALLAALYDRQKTADPIHPYGDNRRMWQLAQRLGVQWLIFGSLRPAAQPNAPPELWLAIYDAQRRVIDAEIRLAADNSTDRLDAFLTRWLACAQVTELAPISPSRSDDVRLDTAASYALYVRHPTREAFHSLGFALGVAQEFRGNLEWFSRLNMYTSISDPYRDLLHTFNSVRAMFGLGFTYRTQTLRVFFRPAIDVHLLGSFIETRDPQCKLFGTTSPQCDRSTLLDLDSHILLGLNLATGVNLDLGRHFFVSLQASMSSYFLPLAGTERLNYPVSGEIGMGYRF